MAAKIEFLPLCKDAHLKTDLTRENTEKFWADIGIQNEYPILSIKALSFIQLPSTYCCEMGFSSMVSTKTKYRNRLEIDTDMRRFLSCTQPRLECLITKKQHQSSN